MMPKHGNMSALFLLIGKDKLEVLMEKIHCFAYLDEHRCNALNEKDCKNCKFYKSKMQFDREIERARRFCKENGIKQYDGFFRYHAMRKKIEAMKRAERNETNGYLQE